MQTAVSGKEYIQNETNNLGECMRKPSIIRGAGHKLRLMLDMIFREEKYNR